MSGHRFLIAAVALAPACAPHPPPPARGDAPAAAARLLGDTTAYRRLCAAAPDSAVDLRRPCELRDQRLPIP